MPIWWLDFFPIFFPVHISQTKNCPNKFDKIDNLANLNGAQNVSRFDTFSFANFLFLSQFLDEHTVKLPAEKKFDASEQFPHHFKLVVIDVWRWMNMK